MKDSMDRSSPLYHPTNQSPLLIYHECIVNRGVQDQLGSSLFEKYSRFDPNIEIRASSIRRRIFRSVRVAYPGISGSLQTYDRHHQILDPTINNNSGGKAWIKLKSNFQVQTFQIIEMSQLIRDSLGVAEPNSRNMKSFFSISSNSERI